MRSSWGDRSALFLGVKGGTNGGPGRGEPDAPGSVHLHDDGGSFQLQSQGMKIVEVGDMQRLCTVRQAGG